MAGEKETKVEQSTGITEKMVEVPPPEVQEKVYTQKDIDALLSEKDKAYKGLQTVISKKDRELKEFQEKLAQSSPGATNTQALQAVITQLDKMAAETGVDTSDLRQAKANLEAEQRKVAAMTIIATEKQKLEKEITDKGEDPTDERFDGVWRDFEFSSYVSGDFNKPKSTLEKTLAKTKPPEPKQPQKTEEEKIEERARQILEEKGLLVSDVSLPSGISAKREEIIAKYARGEISRADYEKAMKSK